MKLKGRDVSLSIEVDGEGKAIIAYARDCSIDVQCDIQEFTSPLSGRGKRYRSGRYSWNVDVGTLIEDSAQPAELLQLLKSGGAATITMDAKLPYDGSLCALTGNVVVRTWNFGAPLQGLATFSASFVGDGELEIIPRRNIQPRP